MKIIMKSILGLQMTAMFLTVALSGPAAAMKQILAFFLIACMLTACNPGPGAGTKWTSYPALASSTTTYNCLVVKCQVADVPAIPAGLDTNVQQFFGISGAGYGTQEYRVLE